MGWGPRYAIVCSIVTCFWLGIQRENNGQWGNFCFKQFYLKSVPAVETMASTLLLDVAQRKKGFQFL